MAFYNLSEIIYEPVNEEYGWGKYGDFKVLIRKSDGYVNVTKLCRDGDKKFGNWMETAKSKELILCHSSSDISEEPLEVVMAGLYETRGTYAHPDLVPHIGSWVSPKFALKVSKIINEYIVREYRELIRVKDTRIDELITEVKSQTREIQSQREEVKSQREELRSQTKEIQYQTREIQSQTRIINQQNKMLEAMNENVIEAVNTLHHVSDKSVPIERLSENLCEQFVIVHIGDNNYVCIRAQTKYVREKIDRLGSDNVIRIVVQLTLRPNSRELWIAIRPKLEEAGITVRGCKFEMELDREDWLISVINECNREKYNELIETKENVVERITEASEDEDVEEQAVGVDSRFLLKKTLAELKQLCRDKEWRGWSKLNKPALVNFILENLSH